MEKKITKKSGTYKAFVIPAMVDLDLTYVITSAGEYVITSDGAYVVVDDAVSKMTISSLVNKIISYITGIGKTLIGRNRIDKDIVRKSKIYKY